MSGRCSECSKKPWACPWAKPAMATRSGCVPAVVCAGDIVGVMNKKLARIAGRRFLIILDLCDSAGMVADFAPENGLRRLSHDLRRGLLKYDIFAIRAESPPPWRHLIALNRTCSG